MTSSMPPSSKDPETLDALSDAHDRLRDEIGRVIVGQEEIIEMVVVCLMAQGHALLVGVPGLAKTLLVRTLASALDLDFSRIQFTPDLMPSDITGTEIIQETSEGGRYFEFTEGPIFANVILADEINRTPPKTQAALLEAMQEQHVTAGGDTHALDDPFFVLATQNPIEQEGTYPLPEAQLDRFMLNVWLDYPTFPEEVEVVRETTAGPQAETEPVMSAEELRTYQAFIRQLPVADNVIEYAVRLVARTRPETDAAPSFIENFLSYGAGPRASQNLVLGAKTLAALDGRLTPDEADVRRMAIPVLRHRIVPSFNAEAEDVSSVDLIERLLDQDRS
ncbi:MAG: MoxR family ATPase [Salinibacter sp.]